MGPTATSTHLRDVAHLMRRAAFGANTETLERLATRRYEDVVDDLVNPERFPEPEMDLFDRFHPERTHVLLRYVAAPWLFRMITTQRPLQEKLTLLWHDVFATGVAKVMNPPMMYEQYEILYERAFANFETILQSVARDPAMVFWLDQQTNHCTAVNENWGRELLELFSLGVGNYTEEDVRNAAVAFTGWTIEQCIPRRAWDVWFPPEFLYREEDHDDSEKTFLGERGTFDGDEIISIIMKQPAHAWFVAEKLYTFFVSDAPNEAHIGELARIYSDSGHEIRETVRALLLSDFFRNSRFSRVRSPAEFVVGTLRLSGEHADPYEWDGMPQLYPATAAMGQELLNPPSVEGWHMGREWINTSSLALRVNFAAEHLGNPEAPGVARIIERIGRQSQELTANDLVDACLYELGGLEVREATRRVIIEELGIERPVNCEPGGELAEAVADAIQLIAAAPEFQLA